MMKKVLPIFFIVLSALFFSGCSAPYTFDKAGMEKLNSNLIKKFGNDAWYTNVGYSTSTENEDIYVVSLDKTDNPKSLKQERWLCEDNNWQQVANVNVDIKNGAPEDYMFQLDKNGVSLGKLGELITDSKTLVQKEKNIKEPKLKIALIATSNIILNKEERITYTIIWEDAEKNTYSYTYGLDGKLKRSNN